VAGYALARRGVLKQAAFDRIMVLSVVGLSPPLAVLSFWVMGLDISIIWLPVLGVVMQFVPGAAALLRARAKFTDSLERGGYVLSNMLRNRGILGLLVVFILYGETGVAYCYLVMSLSGIVLYCLCFPMAGYFHAVNQGGGAKAPSLKSILLNRNQIPMLGVLAGLALNVAHVSRPSLLSNAFPYLLHVTLVTMVLPIGASIDVHEAKKYFLAVADLIPIKFMLTPALVYPIALLVGLEGEALWTVVILACSPTAVNAVFTSRLFKLNVHVAMAAFLLTTAVYLAIVLPIIFLLA